MFVGAFMPCRFQRDIRQSWELRAASLPSLAGHESPIPDKFPSLFHSLGASHKG